MDETALKDLENKIRNVCRDFELEHDARTGNTINVRVEVSGNTITARIVATGGVVTSSVNYMIGRGDDHEMFVPMPEGRVIPPDSFPIVSYASLVMDHSIRTENLPVEDMLTPREKEDYKRKKTGRTLPNSTIPSDADPDTSTI